MKGPPRRGAGGFIEQNARKQKKTTEFYDIVRVIATLLVVVGHSTYPGWSGDAGEISLNLENASGTYYLLSAQLNKAMAWIYGFHMPLFFMLSGALYIYSKKRKTFEELLQAKISRLIIPYYAVGVLYMFPVKRISGFYTKESFMPALEGFLLGGNNGHLWFLIALFWCFLLFYPIEKYILRMAPAAAAMIAAVIYFVIVRGGYQLPFVAYIPGLASAVTNLPYFLLGYLIEDCRKKYLCRRGVTAVVTVVLLLFAALQFQYYLFNEPFLVAIVGSLAIYMLSYCLSQSARFLNMDFYKCLLRNSMYIYFFHDPLNFLILRQAIATGAVNTTHGAILYFEERTFGVVLVSIFLGEIIQFARRKGIKFLCQ